MKSIARVSVPRQILVVATAAVASVAFVAGPAAAAPTWSDPATSASGRISERVRAELTNHDVPGISVAVMRHGEFSYRRGFGYADLADHVPMKPYHVGRLASISKSVGGVLLMSMVERGEVRLDAPTRAYLPEMPEHHSYTVAQLASNRGCVRWYNDTDGHLAERPYDTALEASKEFWDDPLECTPGEYLYSTHGYTILGAALEAAAGDGDSVADLVRHRLTRPYHLGSLRPEDRSDGGVPRMALYHDDNSEASPDHLSWKVLGGGLEASAPDLAEFGHRVASGEIISPESVDTMWTAPNDAAPYGLGWDLGTRDDGVGWVGKSGGQLGAQTYLLIYPEQDIVVSVLSNRQGGGHDMTRLAHDIGELVLTGAESTARPAA